MKKIKIVFFLLSSVFILAQKINSSRFPDLENKIGTHFPIEIFEDSSGNRFSKNFLVGKPTLINFWATTCEPCIEELPYLNQIRKDLGENINLLAITYSSNESVTKFLQKRDFDFTHITGALKQLQSYFPVIRSPMSFVIDKNGNILKIYGSVNSDNYSSVIATL